MDKKVDIEEVLRKLSAMSMEESENLVQRVDMIKGSLEMGSEEEKVVILNKVVANVEETVNRLQNTMGLVKSLL